MWPPRNSGFKCEHPGWRLEEITQEALARCAAIGKQFTERYMNQCWIEQDGEGFTGWRWDKYNVELYIVSAANRYKDIIVMGPRHYSNAMQTAIEAYGGIKLLKAYAGEEYEQGFVDQYGTFYNRKEALELAKLRGQIRYPDRGPDHELISEMLY